MRDIMQGVALYQQNPMVILWSILLTPASWIVIQLLEIWLGGAEAEEGRLLEGLKGTADMLGARSESAEAFHASKKMTYIGAGVGSAR